VSGLLVAGPGEITLVGATVVGGLVAAVLYAAVFVALSAWTSRALVIGLAYVLVWEGLITSLFEGTRALSIREYALAIVNALAGDASRMDTVGGVDATLAVVLAAVVLAGAFGVAAWRLARFEVSEPA
jgi:ABC-2 type transport system permease protein